MDLDSMVDNYLLLNNKSNADQDDRVEKIAVSSHLPNSSKLKMGDVVEPPKTALDSKNGHVERRSEDSDVICIDDSSSESSHYANLQPPLLAAVDIPPRQLVLAPDPNPKPGKSILENFLTRPLIPPPQPALELPPPPPLVDTRKVEPLKINLHREPIKTVIKLPQQEQQQHSPKITIKPLKPPPDVVAAPGERDEIPKLHIKNLNESPSVELKVNSAAPLETSEPHVVPKLTIRNLHHHSSATSTSVNSVDGNGSSSHGSTDSLTSSTNSQYHAVVPKLTIKIDNHSGSPIEKHSKKNNVDDGVMTSEGVKVTFKPIPEPPLPKLTIKTNTDLSDAVVTTSNSNDSDGLRDKLSPIPKLTIKPIQKPEAASEIPRMTIVKTATSNSDETTVPKLTIKTTKAQSADSHARQETIPKLTLKTNSVDGVLTADVVPPAVPKLILKVGNKTHGDELANEHDSEPPEALTKPLEVKTSTTIVEDSPHSPRIILKINKTVAKEVPEPVQEPTVTGGSEETPSEVIDLDEESSDKSQPVSTSQSGQEEEESPVKAAPEDAEEPPVLAPTPQRTRSKRLRKETPVPRPPSKRTRVETPPSKASPEPTESITIDDHSLTPEKFESDVPDEVPVKRKRGRPKKLSVTPSLKPRGDREKENIEKGRENENGEGRSSPVDPLKTTESGSESTSTPKKGGRRRGRGGGRVVEVVKDGKVMQIKMDEGYEDDDSPTFSLYNRYQGRGRGRGRGKRGSRGARGSFSSTSKAEFMTPEGKTSRKFNHQATPVQMFEEDTMMGSENVFQTPIRNLPDVVDESQSSQVSSASATTEGRERKRGKMEVIDTEGRTEFSVDRLAEYDWPPPKPGQKQNRNRETFMIQEQISEYLKIKSFKRKYPDLMRRPVEMEERNYMLERGLVTEKMCDLGLTAVYASEILDIMCNDYPEKFDEYKRYQREKAFLELQQRQKHLQSQMENRGQLQRDKAMESASSWNVQFNKDRLQKRKGCMDLQTYVIHMPKSKRDKLLSKLPPLAPPSNYPIALVPGQFSEHFRTYTPEELACYPVNTVLLNHSKLNDILLKRDKLLNEASSDSSSGSDSDSDGEGSDLSSSSSSSDSEDDEDSAMKTCGVCSGVQNTNTYGLPERFIQCTSCHRAAHPSCIDMTSVMAKRAMEYEWKCSECKICCKCQRAADESKMLFCDQCDRGYHIYCIGLRNVPEGRWHCSICTICTRCGAKTPEGHPNPSLSPNQRQNLAIIANWSHEYRTNNVTKLREHYQTLCQSCQLSQQQSSQKLVAPKSAPVSEEPSTSAARHQ